MPEAMRAHDPLIEACRHMEARRGAQPRLRRRAATTGWRRSSRAARDTELRLIRAACLLHDVNWRAHPDYRAELCFESVIRANVAGVNHAERIFLGLALLNRYKAAGPGEELSRYAAADLAASAPPTRWCSAGRCGSARCCRVRRSACSIMPRSRVEGGRLTLTLAAPARDFAGEAVERRLQTLASRLGLVGETILA